MQKTKSNSLTSSELIKQSEDLRQQAEALKAKEKPQVVANIKAAIAHYGLTASDLGLAGAEKGTKKSGPKKNAAKAGKTVSSSSAAKKRTSKQYRDGNGNTWSGFGPRPQWLKDALAAGASEESLRVQ